MAFELCYNCNEDHKEINDIITWKIHIEPEVDKDEKTFYKEFYINNHKSFPKLNNNFKLKIKYFGRGNNKFEIFYLFPKSVFLKSKLTLPSFPLINRGYTVAEQQYRVVESNKWVYFGTLFRIDIKDYIQNGCLTFVFKFDTITNIVPLENVPKGDLCNDFQYLLDSGLFSDLIIKSTDGTEFNIHKAILAGRSTVIKAHFDHNTLECHKNIVETPFETETLSEVLIFIYSDKSPRVDDIPEKLLAAAEFYQLEKLKHLCEQALCKKLTVDNAVETLELAELYSARLLTQLTLEFIKNGHTKEIVKTEGWTKVKSIDIIKSIYIHILGHNDEGNSSNISFCL